MVRVQQVCIDYPQGDRFSDSNKLGFIKIVKLFGVVEFQKNTVSSYQGTQIPRSKRP